MTTPFPHPKTTRENSKKSNSVGQRRKNRPTIKDWPADDRPREKLVSGGPKTLTESELLAILLRTGHRGKTAIDLAKDLLAGDVALEDLARMDVPTLRSHDLGPVQAATISASFELARRLDGKVRIKERVFQGPEDVVRFLGPGLRILDHEEFHVLLLNAANRLIRSVLVTKGILNSSLVHPRECFADAIREKAQSVIFAHNHPSGNPEPSQEDLAVTRQLVESGKILGIPVHDHIVIAGNSFTSFAERNLL